MNRVLLVLFLLAVCCYGATLPAQAFTIADSNHLIDEWSVAVAMLAGAVEQADRSQAAHPQFLGDLKAITGDLTALQAPLGVALADAVSARETSVWDSEELTGTQSIDFDDAVMLLEGAVSRAERNKAAHPVLLDELGSIVMDLKGLVPGVEARRQAAMETSATGADSQGAAPAAAGADEASDQAAVAEPEDNSLLGSLQKVLEGVEELPRLFEGLESIFPGSKK